MLRPIAKNVQHKGREHLLDDLLFPPMLGALAFGNQREIPRRAVEHDRRQPRPHDFWIHES